MCLTVRANSICLTETCLAPALQHAEALIFNLDAVKVAVQTCMHSVVKAYLRYGLVGDSEKYTEVLSCSSRARSKAPISEGSNTVAVTPILGKTV